jgi:hypothetical protein
MSAFASSRAPVIEIGLVRCENEINPGIGEVDPGKIADIVVVTQQRVGAQAKES